MRQIEARQLRHFDVGDQNHRAMEANRSERLGSVADRGDYLNVGLDPQHHGERASQDALILSEYNCDRPAVRIHE
jgi:hypothetical protein